MKEQEVKELLDLCGAPPKSIYSKLPKQFGFEIVHQHPKMLSGTKRIKRLLCQISCPKWRGFI